MMRGCVLGVLLLLVGSSGVVAMAPRVGEPEYTELSVRGKLTTSFDYNCYECYTVLGAMAETAKALQKVGEKCSMDIKKVTEQGGCAAKLCDWRNKSFKKLATQMQALTIAFRIDDKKNMFFDDWRSNVQKHLQGVCRGVDETTLPNGTTAKLTVPLPGIATRLAEPVPPLLRMTKVDKQLFNDTRTKLTGGHPETRRDDQLRDEAPFDDLVNRRPSGFKKRLQLHDAERFCEQTKDKGFDFFELIEKLQKHCPEHVCNTYYCGPQYIIPPDPVLKWCETYCGPRARKVERFCPECTEQSKGTSYDPEKSSNSTLLLWDEHYCEAYCGPTRPTMPWDPQATPSGKDASRSEIAEATDSSARTTPTDDGIMIVDGGDVPHAAPAAPSSTPSVRAESSSSSSTAAVAPGGVVTPPQSQTPAGTGAGAGGVAAGRDHPPLPAWGFFPFPPPLPPRQRHLQHDLLTAVLTRVSSVLSDAERALAYQSIHSAVKSATARVKELQDEAAEAAAVEAARPYVWSPPPQQQQPPSPSPSLPPSPPPSPPTTSSPPPSPPEQQPPSPPPAPPASPSPAPPASPSPLSPPSSSSSSHPTTQHPLQ